MKKIYMNPEFKCSPFFGDDIVLASVVNDYDNANLTKDDFGENWFN